MQKITPCLWFDTEGEDAATFYTSVFPNSRIREITRYGPAGPRAEGTVMTVSFELDGQEYVALNGGPDFTFNEAISFQVELRGSGGGRPAVVDALRGRPGGSLRMAQGPVRPVVADRAHRPPALLADPDRDRSQRVMQAMLEMRKIDIAALEAAAAAA